MCRQTQIGRESPLGFHVLTMSGTWRDSKFTRLEGRRFKTWFEALWPGLISNWRDEEC